MPLMRNALAVLLAGGQGERLWPLTRDRAKPAVPFGGIYRIIDVTLSNCLNSDLRRVFVLTQYKALSLNRHIRRGWSLLMGHGDFIEVLPPQMRVSQHWYQGTADAVYQNIYSIGCEQSNFVFILSGDHIYKMNYQKMLEQHVEAGADVTVATIEVSPREAAGSFGVIETDKDWRIVGFEEKPVEPKRSRIHPDKVNASMGVYLFNTQLLVPILIADAEDPTSNHDFGKDIIPRIIEKHRVFAYNFRDENKKEESYWRDVGTVEAYHEANMDLVSVSPVFNLYDKSWPLHTWQQQYPPAKFVFADPSRMGVALDSIVGSRLDCFWRTRHQIRPRPRRPRKQLQRTRSMHRLQSREHRPQLPHPPRHHRPPREPARRHRNRLRHRSRPRPLLRHRTRRSGSGPPRIHDRRTRITLSWDSHSWLSS